jgi:pimeloyl-ACP methyl ester carboxylesterase
MRDTNPPRATSTAPRIVIDERAAGRPILLLHAFPLSSRMWDGQRAVLASLGRVLAADFPGFGQSPAPTGYPSMQEVAEALLLELSRRRIGSLCAVGSSMGGYLLLEMVRQRPALFDKLVLANTRAEADSPEQIEKRRQSARRSETQGVAHLCGMVSDLLGPRANHATQRHLRDLILEATPQGAAAASLAMAGRRDQREILSTIACPTLVIAGGADAIIPTERSTRMAASIPNARLRILPGVGHLSNLEAEEAFNRALFSFLG